MIHIPMERSNKVLARVGYAREGKNLNAELKILQTRYMSSRSNRNTIS